MRSAAMVLGIIGGCLAVLVGFFSYGYTEAVDRFGEVEGLLGQVADPALIRTASFSRRCWPLPGALWPRSVR